jgi:hypothetical protein
MTRAVWVTILMLLPACKTSSKQEVPLARVAAQEQRLLQPFVGNYEVGCAELAIETTSNFIQKNIGLPAMSPGVHTRKRVDGPGYRETVWTNPTGDLASALLVTVGETSEVQDLVGFEPGHYTKFTVLNQLRVRVYDNHAMTLNAEASGTPLVFKNADVVTKDLTEFRIEDGVLHRK